MEAMEVNGCKHYLLNEKGDKRLYFTDSKHFIEPDHKTKHPIGLVYKPKGCMDTNIRFVRLPNRSVLVFNLREWERYDNPFNTLPKDTLKHELHGFFFFWKQFFEDEKSAK